LLADPGVEKLFHDADYDLRIFDRDYGFRAKRLFDTRVAAQLAGEPAVGLAALLAKYVGVKLAKEHQKADWSRRPLPPSTPAAAPARRAARAVPLARDPGREAGHGHVSHHRERRAARRGEGAPPRAGGPGDDPRAALHARPAARLQPARERAPRAGPRRGRAA